MTLEILETTLWLETLDVFEHLFLLFSGVLWQDSKVEMMKGRKGESSRP